MHYIDITQQKIIDAQNIHYEYMRYVIKKKLNGKYFTEPKPNPNIKSIHIVSGIHSEVKRFLNVEKNLRKVLVGTPEELDSIKSRFTTKKEIDSIKRLFDYEMWIDYNPKSTYHFYNAYDLAKNLDIPTCPYCNRIYTKTVTNPTKITRPTFDHWFPKSKYPLLALSFYNLVPSCNICNMGKSNDPFSLNTHFHPYHKSVNPAEILSYRFSFDYKDYSSFKFKIVPDNTFSEKSTKAFKLEDIYKMHEDEIVDLRQIRDVYSVDYLEMVKKKILLNHISEEEIYRLAFGVHIDEAKFDRRPLSKMKKDILKELGII
ncbi:hypothetical protein GCM10022386_07280 [Flavobacterium cheonhonense]|uniref:HNH endonuclease n=1 Tax=Flavobacterium cheonhonense TaxID=706185 RepID=A0ABP7THI1_9FLAO|nr:hypothetical protein [Flavobacterium cheonhonense]